MTVFFRYCPTVWTGMQAGLLTATKSSVSLSTCERVFQEG